MTYYDLRNEARKLARVAAERAALACEDAGSCRKAAAKLAGYARQFPPTDRAYHVRMVASWLCEELADRRREK